MSPSGGRQPTSEELESWSEFCGSVDAQVVRDGRRVAQDELEDWNDSLNDRPLRNRAATVRKRKDPQAAGPPARSPRVPPSSLETIGIGISAKEAPERPEARVGGASGRAAAISLDRKLLRRMKTGRQAPEAKLDLHGLGRSEAEGAVRRFVRDCRGKDMRLLLIITGKGGEKRADGPIPEKTGILKQSLPVWLRSPPLSEFVQSYCLAHPVHGGSGAFYVFLKRRRPA